MAKILSRHCWTPLGLGLTALALESGEPGRWWTGENAEVAASELGGGGWGGGGLGLSVLTRSSDKSSTLASPSWSESNVSSEALAWTAS